MAEESGREALAGPPGPERGFFQVVAGHAAREPDAVTCSAVRPVGERFEVQGISLERLLERARGFVRTYRERGVGASDRVLFSLASPQEVLAGVLGGMGCGAVTVPLQTAIEFRTPALFRERLAAVAADCRPTLVVVEQRAAWEQATGGIDLGAPVVGLEEVEASGGREFAFAPPAGSHPALVQYTSGSTGDPRGVVLTHDNVTANLTSIGRAVRMSASDRLVFWLPLHHDMGLIGCLLFACYWKMPAFVLSPMTFFLRPVSWLRAVQEFGATLTVAPTFAYAICAGKIPDAQLEGLDLSSLRLALCGAEPVRAEVVDAFCRRFARHGFRRKSFYPVYGLAEATLAVTFPELEVEPETDVIDRQALARDGSAQAVAEDHPWATRVTSVGRAVPDVSLRIEDPATGEALPERRAGEVVVFGPSVSPRYWGEDGPPRQDLHTGDLGYVAGDRLFIVDRIKDLVIVAGQNYAPSDLEACAARTRGVRAGRVAAFSLPGPEGTERVHFLAELDRRSWRPQREVAAEIGRRVQEHFGLAVAQVCLVRPGVLPRTTSGKLKRRACRQLFLDGACTPLVPLGERLASKLEVLLYLLRRKGAAVQEGR